MTRPHRQRPEAPRSNHRFAGQWADYLAIYVCEKKYMKLNSGIAAAIVLSFAVAGLTACEKKGPAERAGEKIDDTVKKVGEKVEEAGDKIKDAAKDAKK